MRRVRAWMAMGFAAASFCAARPAYCRWANDQDASAAVAFENDDFEVDADGGFRETVEQEIEVLRESARRDQGARRIYFNASAGSFKLLKAEVLNDGKRTEVDPASVENKPLASRGSGFDQLNQVLIAFPEIKSGSRTYLKYSKQVKEVPFKGFFSARIGFDNGMLTRARRIRFVSELPLFVETHDLSKSLHLIESRQGDKYSIEISLTQPIHEAVVDEEDPSFLSSEKTWFVVSSLKSHAEMIKTVVGKYEEILDSPLPEQFERIRLAAAGLKTSVEKINFVTSSLAESVRYMGDWRTVSGGFVPRGLETVARTRFGDCKDFASVTAAILRKLGIQAQVAWVERSAQPSALPKLPLSEAFNHAIVRAEVDGKVYWVDPTNLQSFAQGIFPDIIGRQALVLASGQRDLIEAIPAARPEDSRYGEKFSLESDKRGDAIFDFEMTDAGRMAISMTGASLEYSKESIDHILLTSMVTLSHVKNFKVGSYELTSRVVRDLRFSLKVKTRNSFARTSAGLGYLLPPPEYVGALINLETPTRVSAYFMTQPFSFERVYELKKIRVIGHQYRGCDIRSPWMNISRVFTHVASGLRVSEKFQILTPRIANAELKSAAFGGFQAKLQECFDRIQIIFLPQATPRS